MGVSRRQKTLGFVTFIVLSFCYSMLAFSYIVHMNIQSSVDEFSKNLQMSVYLQPLITEKETQKIEEYLKKISVVNQVTYTSSQQAHKRFFKEMENQLKKINIKDESFLPSSFDLKFDPNYSVKKNMFKGVVDKINTLSGVDEVIYSQDMFENYAGFRKTYLSVSSVLWLLIIATCILIVGNMVRASVIQRANEIEILELVGATPSYIMKPYLKRGALLGLSASVLALFSSYLVSQLVTHHLLLSISQAWSNITIEFFGPIQIILFLMIGTLVGLLSSFLSLLTMNFQGSKV